MDVPRHFPMTLAFFIALAVASLPLVILFLILFPSRRRE